MKNNGKKKQNLKILHVVQNLDGGIRTYMQTVLPALAQLGFELHLLYHRDPKCKYSEKTIKKLISMGVTVKTIKMFRPIRILKDLISLYKLTRYISHNNFDIIHSHCSKAGALARIAAKLTNQKIIIHTPHCLAFLRCKGFVRKKIYYIIEWALGKITTAFFAVSRSEIQALIQTKVSSAKCFYIPNSVTAMAKTETHTDKFRSPNNHKIVLTACRFIEYKGLEIFIDSAKSSRHPNTLFLIAGKGDIKNKLINYARKKQVQDKIVFTGFYEDMAQLYSIADIFVLASKAEGQPYVILESMQHQIPVVATDVPGNNDLISHNQTGLLTAHNPKQIAKSIDILLGDPAKSQTISQNAFEYISQNHTLSKQVDMMSNLYRQLYQCSKK